jgi:F-type H+-transporting ATPase subunit b
MKYLSRSASFFHRAVNCQSKKSFYLTVAFFFAAGLAAASEGGEQSSHFNILNELARVFNFVFVVGVLYFLLAKLLREFFKKRREDIAHLLEESENEKREAQKKLAKIEGRTKEIENEISRIREDSKNEADLIYKEIMAAAKVEAEKLFKKAEFEIEMELKQAKLAIKREASHLAINAAEEIIKKELNQKDHNKLIENFVNNIAG